MVRGWRAVNNNTARRGVVFQLQVLLTDRVAVVVEKAFEQGWRDAVDLDELTGGLVVQVMDNSAEQGVWRWSDRAIDEGGRRRA